jgi:hypothetical protein
VLTLDKLKTYHRFHGDIDGFVRSRDDEQSGITDEDWQLIDELRQALFVVKSGQASPEFAASVEQRLLSVTADEATRTAVRELVNE